MASTSRVQSEIMDVGFEQDIRKFKVDLCDETMLIIEGLKRDFSGFVLDPILDVGAGFQAISEQSFPGRDITLLDKIDYDHPAQSSRRVTADFFDYSPAQMDRPNTILFCHVLQYIDDDLTSFYRKISELSPNRIIAVVNDNDQEFGEVVKWAKTHLPSANPEFEVPMGPCGYQNVKRTHIQAQFACPDFETLAYQFGRLILDLSVPTSRSKSLAACLKSVLSEPTITINQSIIGYEKRS